MLFPVSDHTRVGEERLARLLAEPHSRPLLPVTEKSTRSRDPARMLVTLLLLAAVGGTWCLAYLLS